MIRELYFSHSIKFALGFNFSFLCCCQMYVLNIFVLNIFSQNMSILWLISLIWLTILFFWCLLHVGHPRLHIWSRELVFNRAAACWSDCRCVWLWSERLPMTHLCQEAALVTECYSETQKNSRRQYLHHQQHLMPQQCSLHATESVNKATQ